jgi:hypothetical protein
MGGGIGRRMERSWVGAQVAGCLRALGLVHTQLELRGGVGAHLSLAHLQSRACSCPLSQHALTEHLVHARCYSGPGDLAGQRAR